MMAGSIEHTSEVLGMSGRAVFDAGSVSQAIPYFCDCELPKLDATQKVVSYLDIAILKDGISNSMTISCRTSIRLQHSTCRYHALVHTRPFLRHRVRQLVEVREAVLQQDRLSILGSVAMWDTPRSSSRPTKKLRAKDHFLFPRRGRISLGLLVDPIPYYKEHIRTVVYDRVHVRAR